ncbi:MAG: glycosyltransferase family 2 protein [Armatimonadota bacterium]
MKILIAIPTYNEENTVALVINCVKQACGYDILIYDDGSTDGTLKTVKSLKDIIIKRHKKRKGYGQTVRDIFNYAVKHNYDYLIKMDADLQHETKYIKEFVKHMKKYDVVSGSRYHKRSPVISGAPGEREKINKKITGIINKITGYKITDSFCGFKAYKVKFLKKLELTEKGYGFPVEFWIQAYKNKFTLKEIPVSLIYIKDRRDFTGKIKNSDYRLNCYLKIIKKDKQIKRRS